MSSLGRFFGSIERFLASLLPYRVPVAIVLVAVLAVLVALVIRQGWHRAAGRWVLAHRTRSAALAVVVLAVTLPLGNYLLSPLWQRTALIEASPLEVAAAASTSAPGASGGTSVSATTAAPAASGSPGIAPAPKGTSTVTTAAASSPAASPPATSTALAAPTSASTPSPSPAVAPRLIARGMFAGADDFHFGRGDALLIEMGPRTHTLRFENFSVRNGPDLFVYLSDDPKGYGGTVLKLGRLRATDGSFNYEVPEGTDISRFRSAIVWCDQFAFLFATAPLR